MTKTTEARYREDQDEDFRISYDDQPNEIVDEIGRALKKHGLSIIDDGKPRLCPFMAMSQAFLCSAHE